MKLIDMHRPYCLANSKSVKPEHAKRSKNLPLKFWLKLNEISSEDYKEDRRISSYYECFKRYSAKKYKTKSNNKEKFNKIICKNLKLDIIKKKIASSLIWF